MSRIAQLTNKSNQFNLTTRRYTQSDIERFAADDTCITRYGKLEDKFGDNGVVSVVIGRKGRMEDVPVYQRGETAAEVGRDKPGGAAQNRTRMCCIWNCG